ncbi:MAG: ABC transporter substrate-binding protein [Alphaproteobacteria bacterium]|jgi:branched-chain amino acid transport system substrate-binding protein|uniref:ABC transporter substrate-binding protein n=1 Tax=Pacificispira sp. TaxID=2888761 RepID=UPI001AFE8E18|nr:ABC transporter substrate-binding protein [Alphaproteobacteria bacterium]MEC9268193.1 ABC transporter substrate-binding protein [Pseudomonadota bacterium]
MKKMLLGAALGAVMMAGPAFGASHGEPVKIGFVTTLTTPAAVIGNDMKNAFDLALEHIGGEMGGRKVEVIYEDDGFKPEVGKQASDKLVKQDEVDFVTGFIWSHVLLASSKSVLDSGTFLISANAGPSQLAGKGCHENFFSVSWQNDQTPMALGEALNANGVNSVYIMAPNYAAGKDMVAGVERTFKGEVKGKDLTKWGADAQLDFSAELAKAKASGAEAIWVFYPGKAGGAFIQQYTQAGLQDSLPLYSVFTVDALSLPRLKDAGLTGVLGSRATQHWSPDLDNEANKKFVTDFLAKYGSYPSFYAQQSYDAMMLIKSAVDAVGGDLSDKDAVRAALAKADFASTRGGFKFGNNHFPVQNFYLREAVEDSEGRWTTKVVSTVYEDHQDPHAADCGM